MIFLPNRGGAGVHTLCALLDYCTKEGGLDDYPIMVPGDNLHSHIPNHNKITKKFYNSAMHIVSDDIMYKKIFNRYWFNQGKIEYKKTTNITLAPIAKDDFGRLLICTMSLGKCKNKKLPPDDDTFDYSNYAELSDKIELISLSMADQLKQSFEHFFGHDWPTYHIDVLWYWSNPDKICTVIEQCGWTPIVDKVHEFCQRVTVFNAPYHSIVQKSFEVYQQILNKQDMSCNLTFYETAMIHALLINYHGCNHPSQIKLIHKLPTSTGEFFNLYNPTTNQ